ncbi:hypothetical protein [Noviherbaspirillum sp.]|uniref:hypothetical protein n=1 Tax=Noviherbaspirillum sp. TaxID=1926288 RepID=UPI002FE1521A
MDPGLIGIFVLCSATLVLLLSVAWAVNKVIKRPLLNGAAVFFWLLIATIIGLLAYQWSLPHVTERMAYYAGKSIAAVAPVLLVAFVLMRRFRAGRVVRDDGARKT